MEILFFSIFCIICLGVCALILFFIYWRAIWRIKRNETFNTIRISLIKLEDSYNEYVAKHDMSQFSEIARYLSGLSSLNAVASWDFSNIETKPMAVRKILSSSLAEELICAPHELTSIVLQYSRILRKLSLTKHPIKTRILDIKKNINLRILRIYVELLFLLLKHKKGTDESSRKIERAKQLEELADSTNFDSKNIYVAT